MPVVVGSGAKILWPVGSIAGSRKREQPLLTTIKTKITHCNHTIAEEAKDPRLAGLTVEGCGFVIIVPS
jgi:hypothetical protein